MSSSTATRAASALIVALVLLAACGGEDGERAATQRAQPVDVDPVGIDRNGSVSTFADCADWKGATRDQRLATIADIRDQFTPQESTTGASPLPDERAYAIFEEACAPEFADSFRLYKLYVRAQGFAPLSEPQTDSP